DAALHRRPVTYRRAPPRDVRKLLKRLTERLRDQHPWPGRHVGDRILAEDEFAPFQPPLQHAEAAVVFVGVALVRIRVLALHVVDEMAELSRHWSEIADLPEQPFQHLFAGALASR